MCPALALGRHRHWLCCETYWGLGPRIGYVARRDGSAQGLRGLYNTPDHFLQGSRGLYNTHDHFLLDLHTGRVARRDGCAQGLRGLYNTPDHFWQGLKGLYIRMTISCSIYILAVLLGVMAVRKV